MKYKVTKIGGCPSNYYGGLCVLDYNGRYYWTIENYDTYFDEDLDINDWEEINYDFYLALISSSFSVE